MEKVMVQLRQMATEKEQHCFQKAMEMVRLLHQMEMEKEQHYCRKEREMAQLLRQMETETERHLQRATEMALLLQTGLLCYCLRRMDWEEHFPMTGRMEIDYYCYCFQIHLNRRCHHQKDFVPIVIESILSWAEPARPAHQWFLQTKLLFLSSGILPRHHNTDQG